MEPQTYHGKTITGKGSEMVYFSEHKRHGSYQPLKRPWRRHFIRHETEPSGLCGWQVTKKVWDTFDVPDISQPEPEYLRPQWREELSINERMAAGYSY